MSTRNGWQRGVLGESCSIEIGGTPSRSVPAYWDDAKETDNLWASIKDLSQRVVTHTAEHISDAGVAHSNVKLQESGSILLSFKLTIGRVATAGKSLYTNEAIAGLRSDRIDHDFLFYGLQQWDLLRGVDQAIKGATLNKEKLRKITFDYPERKAEQAKIAEILSTVDRAIQQTEALIAKQQRIKTGLMQDLLTRGIDEHGNLRSEETHQFKDSPLGRIPVEWNCSAIVKSLALILDCRGRTPKKLGMNWGGGEIPALSAMNVEMGHVNLQKDTYYGSEALYARWMTNGDSQRGDVVMTTEAPLGNVAQIPDDRPYILSQRVILMRGASECLENDFLRHYLASPRFQNRMIEQSSGTTATGIQRRKFEQLPVPLPKPDEQIRISHVLGRSDSLLSQLSLSGTKLMRKKTALMQDLLTGEKRVTPLLEPAMTT